MYILSQRKNSGFLGHIIKFCLEDQLNLNIGYFTLGEGHIHDALQKTLKYTLFRLINLSVFSEYCRIKITSF